MKCRLIATVAVLGVLVAGAAIGDGVAREHTQQRLATDLAQQVSGLGAPPDVRIIGFPFLTQILAGHLDDVRLTAPSLTVQGLLLEHVDVRLRDVSTDTPMTAGQAVVEADVSLANLQKALDLPADLAIRDGHLVASTTVLGLSLEALLVPRPAGRAIAVDLTSLSLGGQSVDASSLPSAIRDQLSGLSIPVDALPAGMELTAVTLTDSGAHLEARGTDVVLEVPA
ncbi:MAG TPA: DUF2993 domain-containing protein [Propionicimonas sp.]|jgi:hypothetical protein